MTTTPDEIKKAGIKALTKELGVSGMIKFIQQFDLGMGDYTKERKQIISNVTMDDVKEFVKSKDDN